MNDPRDYNRQTLNVACAGVASQRERQKPFLVTIEAELAMLRERLGSVESRVHSINTRAFGVIDQVQESQPEREPLETKGSVHSVRELLNRINTTINHINKALDSTETLV